MALRKIRLLHGQKCKLCGAAIVKYLNKKEKQRSPASFINETLEEASKLPRMEFHHIGREQKSLAHSLAHLAKRLFHSAVWRERFPACVEHIVAQDVMQLNNP